MAEKRFIRVPWLPEDVFERLLGDEATGTSFLVNRSAPILKRIKALEEELCTLQLELTRITEEADQ